MLKNINKAFGRYPILIECTVITAGVAYLIYAMRSMLLFGQATLVHDNILWNYPIFKFFAENVINGHFPLWNPFEHSGEPFYPLLGQAKLLDPITLLTIYLGHFISNDIVILFNWDHFIRSLIMVGGVYIVFRTLAANPFVRLSLIPILLYSSFMLGSFRENFTFQFLWISFITYFLLRIVYYKDSRWHNWFLLASFIGLNWQSYFFSGTWIFLFLFSIGVILFRRDLVTRLFKNKMINLKLALLVFIILAMAMPNVVLMLEKDKYVFPARMIDSSYEGMAPKGGPLEYEGVSSSAIVDGINMPYGFIAFTGTFSNIWDFIQIIAPDGNKHIRWPNRAKWGKPSEAYMYIGFLPWAIAILGLISGRHDLKRVWLLVFACFALLMLGPPGVLHRLLYYIYPPMWFVRHTHTLVLFFMFTLLYFYILGLNHIFSAWGGYIFHQHTSRGILGRFIKDKRVCNGIAAFIFSLTIILSVYWMTKLTYPATNYLFILLILVFAAGWLLRSDLGENGLYISLIASHIIIVFLFSPNTFRFLKYIVPALGIPIISYILIKSHRNSSKWLVEHSPLIILSIFSICLTADIINSFWKSSFLYNDKEYSAYLINSERISNGAVLPENRSIFPPVFYENIEQRYLSLIYQKPYVFSSIKDPDYSGRYVRVKGVFNGLRNRSFEDWIAAKESNYLSEEFSYHQDGSGGVVERYTGHDGVKDGSAAVLLKPSSAGDSYIRFQTSQIEEIRGKYIRLSIWVKSQNKFRDAVQVEVQDYILRPDVSGSVREVRGIGASKFYKNSNEWEQLLVGKYIDKNATKLVIRCNIKSTATSPVFFDAPLIEIVDVNTNAFEYALRSKRWSSFLLPRKYFELINKDIQPLILEEMFAVGKPVFQFKQGIISVKESEIPAFFKRLGSDRSVKLLHEAVIVDEQTGTSLTNLIVSDENIVKAIPAVAQDFTHTIEKYDYNSLNMKATIKKPGILYWADGYDNNWHAYINGKEVPIYRANINFKAINIQAGTNNISFTYKPFLFKIGLYIFYGIVIMSIIPAVFVFIAVFYCNFLQNGLLLKIRRI